MSETQTESRESLYRQAMAFIDQEWLAEGVTVEELRRSERLATLFDQLVSAGHSADEVIAAWEGRDPDDILREAEGNGRTPLPELSQPSGAGVTAGAPHRNGTGVSPNSTELEADPAKR